MSRRRVQDPAVLLGRLLDLATQERECLRAEAWDDVLTVRAAFDEAFAALQRSVGAGKPPLSCRDDLVRLERLHAENVQLTRLLRDKAGNALAEINKVSRIGSYAPLGPDNEPTPRYLDQSA